MKQMKKFTLALISLIIANGLFGYNHDQNSNGKKETTSSATINKANCAPASSKLIMDFNDVKALMEPGGLLFLDRANGAAYEVPKGGGVMAIYAGSLWMGGTDVNGQLKLAAQRFRDSGVDFWTGPLTVTAGSGNYDPTGPVGDNARRDFGEATIIPEQCLAYDKFFTISKAEVIQFKTYYEYTKNPVGDPVDAPSNEVMNRINNWPAHGDVSLGQDFFLAPFFDNNSDGIYDPLEGDYPWYDDILGRDDVECGVDRRITLFGDQTHWWVFNDKGNIHGETGGDPIGMEIRAQAFAFATDDEINRMTFYNYELINRGTQTLKDTYFSKYVDSDLGNYNDDYVGCDVTRGLGYCYNGDLLDEQNTSSIGYGEDPPAIGIDFFEGPYQDADGKDNVGPQQVIDANGNLVWDIPTVNQAIADQGIVYKGIGLGYGDGVIDNERFGMRSFTYYTATGNGPGQSDPRTAAQHYNFMRGLWSNGTQPVYGGTGYPGSTGATQIEADYMMPDDSDTLDWGTAGNDPGFNWSEVTNNNQPGDRRFVQSAGPFTLKPGAVNNITVGVVYGRSNDGDLFASVRALKRADTKAQALFDNCFRIFEPPQAPKMTIQELDNAVVLMLDNPTTSNNYQEKYEEEDKINIPDDITDRWYRFEGYQIYQLAGEDNSAADIGDPAKARLVAQCDIKNGIGRIINFEFDEGLGFSIPEEKVNGEDKGIRHSFLVTEDQFAQGNRTLVNNKKYYFTAIAYGYNNFKTFDPTDPASLDGQKRPYVSSRIGYNGEAIEVVETIPHDPKFENYGTVARLDYGSSPEITRLDGRGNGNQSVDLTQSSIDFIVKNGYMTNPTYEKGSGPLNIKVVDPLNVVSGYFECLFKDYTNNGNDESRNYDGTDTASWVINRYDVKGGTLLESVTSDQTIAYSNEQLIPEWGISVQIFQTEYYFPSGTGAEYQRYSAPIEATIEYADSTRQWLDFIPDDAAFFPTNWIRSGDFEPTDNDKDPTLGIYNPGYYGDEVGKDDNKSYAKLLGGGIAPYRLVGYEADFMPICYDTIVYKSYANSRNRNSISRAPSVDIVFTSDKSKWTRCAVIELGRDQDLNVGAARAGNLRQSLSVDKNGNPDGSGSIGMGWFPGYAIDVETGMRLHMAFGENSFLGGENGSDMIWNPTSSMTNSNGDPLFGGLQPIYVFGYRINDETDASRECPYYDGTNNWVYDKFAAPSSANFQDIYMNLTWVCNPLLKEGQTLMSNDCRIRVRINKEYNDFVATNANGGRPMYSWSMDEFSTIVGASDVVKDNLSEINVVPNPYYAYAEYERNRLDTRVKLTNLPEQCTIKIYNVSGKLIRTFKKDNDLTYLDWDMKNHKGIPISSGVYLIHVDVPDVGETVLKFFGGVRQIDLENI